MAAPPEGSTRPAPVFRARGLTKVYRTGLVEVQALRGVDLDLYEGEMVVLLGPSGSGKSTLLNILGGLDTPTSGEVAFRGTVLGTLDDRAMTAYRRRYIGFVFQFYNLIPSLTARENVALVTEIAEAPMTPREALALVGLENRTEHFPAELSGGEQQRVAIARAVILRPKLILADEVTGNLDSQNEKKVIELLNELNRSTGVSILFVTHNQELAQSMDRVIVMRDGQILSNSPR